MRFLISDGDLLGSRNRIEQGQVEERDGVSHLGWGFGTESRRVGSSRGEEVAGIGCADPDDLVFPARDRAALWSDSSSDGERREEAEATDEPSEPAEGAVAKGGAARWWKMPLEVLRLWALRAARSAWSVPVAVTLLGIAVLGRRLYRMRRQSKAVARIRLVLDEKKASQFKAQASRLNESIPMVRPAPIIKPLLPANGVSPWPVLGHL